MKRALFLALLVIVLTFALLSCQNAEEYYADRKIRIQVSHISGLNLMPSMTCILKT